MAVAFFDFGGDDRREIVEQPIIPEPAARQLPQIPDHRPGDQQAVHRTPEGPEKTKGDEFDEFFDTAENKQADAKKQVMDRALEKMMMMQQQQQQGRDDVLLDPMGWPLQQAGFETTTTTTTADPFLPPTATAAAVLLSNNG
ncbi:MAG: hypothetical protein HGA66_05970, partial [Holophaga sp.]|nr:hypothetical protein [Holophaga sp.]